MDYKHPKRQLTKEYKPKKLKAEGLTRIQSMKSIKNKVYIITDKNGEPYVGFWFTRKDAKSGHCDHLGYIKWKEAYNAGDRCIEATLRYKAKRYKAKKV